MDCKFLQPPQKKNILRGTMDIHSLNYDNLLLGRGRGFNAAVSDQQWLAIVNLTIDIEVLAILVSYKLSYQIFI